MLAQITSHPFASLMALVGMLCMVGWPLARTRRAMLIVQIGIGVGFGLHYALLGNLTASAVNALGAVQVAIALCLGDRPGLRWIGWAFVPAVVAAAFLTWQGLPTIVAAAGTLFIALARVQSNPIRMRILVLAGCPFWIFHDLLVGSPVIVADVLSLVTGVVLLMRQCPPPANMGRHNRSVATFRVMLRRSRTAIVLAPVIALLAGCDRTTPPTAAPVRSEIERGAYLVNLGGCADCHTAGHFTGVKGGPGPLAGSDIALTVPGMGAFVGPNLTPDAETGLGSWSKAEIVAALKTGARPDGRVLAPIMPWPGLGKLDDADLQAIAAYLQSLPPVRNQVAGPFGPNDHALPVASMQIVPPTDAPRP